MNLHQKTNLAVIATAFLSLAVVSLLFFNLQKREILNAEKARIQTLKRNIENIVSESLLANDPLMLADYLRTLIRSSPEIGRVEVGGKENYFLENRKARGEKFRPEEMTSGPYSLRIYLRAAKLEEERKRALSGIFRNFALASALTLFVSAFMSFAVTSGMKKRLDALSRLSGKISRNEFGAKVAVEGNDEISALAASFNMMSEKLSELEKMKKIFISSATHELKSPLGIISSYLGMIAKREKLSEKSMDEIKRIRRNISRLSNFVTALLTAARMDSGKFEIRRENCDIRNLLGDVRDFFLPKAREKKLGILLEIPENAAEIKADPEMLGRAVGNFLSNAVKFTPPGKNIKIGARREGKTLEISVADEGPGMEKEEIEKLFLPFSKGENKLNREGTGLGLYIASEIAKAHGGRVKVESEKGKGSVFAIQIPDEAAENGGTSGGYPRKRD